MFSLKENGEFEINTYLNGGTEVDPSAIAIPDDKEYFTINTVGEIDGMTVDKYHAEKMGEVADEGLRKCLNEELTCTQEQITTVLKAITKNGFGPTLKEYGPRALVNLLKALGFKGVRNSRNMIVPQPISQINKELLETLGGKKATVVAVEGEEEEDTMTGGADEVGQLMMAVASIVNYFSGAQGSRFLNGLSVDGSPDASTGVRYNLLKEQVDYEALQHQINESHLRFKLSVQGLFGSIGYNPKISVGVSGIEGVLSGGYTVTKDQLQGGMLPALIPMSVTSKVPRFSEDIEAKINQSVSLLKSQGKKLVDGSQKNIDEVIAKVKEEEKQLETLATALENMAKDPNSPSTVSAEEVEKYSDKLKSHQTKTVDIAKALLNIVQEQMKKTPAETEELKA